jgi:hypothetical protein
MMFPFPLNLCFGSTSCSGFSRQDHLQGKLRFLKMMRDGLETRLAALNAAISTVERQLGDEDAA